MSCVRWRTDARRRLVHESCGILARRTAGAIACHGVTTVDEDPRYPVSFWLMRVSTRSASGSKLSSPRFAGSHLAGNQMVAHLPPAIRERLDRHGHRITLKRGQSIFLVHERLETVYFPETAVLALVTRLRGGEALDVALVGKDGLAGAALLLGVRTAPCEAIVEIGGTAIRLSADLLKAAARESLAFHDLLGRYACAMFAHTVQTTACNTFHDVHRRCARWLLMLHDLAGADEFPLTQQHLATMLGVRRASVTVAARALQRAGLIDYHRGRVRIRKREGLEAASCECYRLVRLEQHRLLGY